MDDGLLDLTGDLQDFNTQFHQRAEYVYNQVYINQSIIQQSLSGVNTYE